MSFENKIKDIQVQMHDQIDANLLRINALYQILARRERELQRYKKGYQILINYFDDLPDDLKEKAHKDLQKENL